VRAPGRSCIRRSSLFFFPQQVRADFIDFFLDLLLQGGEIHREIVLCLTRLVLHLAELALDSLERFLQLVAGHAQARAVDEPLLAQLVNKSAMRR
jgi:hypothetical protein